MRIVHGKPQFKGKPKRSPLDTCEPYLLLKQHIAAGKMAPQQIIGLELTEADAKEFGVKNVGRLVKDHLTRFLKRNNLLADYRVTWRTLANGDTYVGVVYEPPMVVPKPKRTPEVVS
jgi:hypothetical protein